MYNDLKHIIWVFGNNIAVKTSNIKKKYIYIYSFFNMANFTYYLVDKKLLQLSYLDNQIYYRHDYAHHTIADLQWTIAH